MIGPQWFDEWTRWNDSLSPPSWLPLGRGSLLSPFLSRPDSPSPTISVQRLGGSTQSPPRLGQDGSIRAGDVRPDPRGQGRGLESRKDVGGLTFQAWDCTQCVATGQGQVVEAVWPQSCVGQAQGRCQVQAGQTRGRKPWDTLRSKWTGAQTQRPGSSTTKAGNLSSSPGWSSLKRPGPCRPAPSLPSQLSTLALSFGMQDPSDWFWQPQEGGLPWPGTHPGEFNSSISPSAARPPAQRRSHLPNPSTPKQFF